MHLYLLNELKGNYLSEQLFAKNIHVTNKEALIEVIEEACSSLRNNRHQISAAVSLPSEDVKNVLKPTLGIQND